MKKLVVTMCAVGLMICSAQAAAITWSTGNMSALPVNTAQTYATDWQGQVVSFYVVGAGYDRAALLAGLADQSTTAATLASLGSADLTGALTGSKAFGFLGTGTGSFAALSTVYGIAIVKSAGYSTGAGTVDFAVSQVVSAVLPAAGDGSIGFGGAVGFGTVDVVPEPTSMALLALGAAAFGLRRRFKK